MGLMGPFALAGISTSPLHNYGKLTLLLHIDISNASDFEDSQGSVSFVMRPFPNAIPRRGQERFLIDDGENKMKAE
jgi:hypothetical protein